MKTILLAGILSISAVYNSTAQIEIKEEPISKKTGFTNYTSITYAKGISEIKSANDTISDSGFLFGVHSSFGDQVNDKFYLGLGLGIERDLKSVYVPFSIDTYIALTEGKRKPLIGLSLARGLNVNSKTDNRTNIHLTYGIKTPISEKSDFFFQIGYKWSITKVWTYESAMSSGSYSKSDGYDRRYFQYITFTAGFKL